jgi:hypothetical protein
MTKGDELRALAREAFERSERADTLAEAQWFLKLRRVLTEAADAFGVPNVIRLPGGGPRPVLPNVSAEQYEKDRGQ